MATTTAASDGGQDAVRDLYRWLREDPDVRRSARPALVSAPDAAEQRPGTAMGAVEIIELVLGQGFSALNLALAYAAWRGQRPAAPPIVIQLGDGRSVTVHDGSAETVRRIVAALEEPAGRPQDAADAADAADPDGTGAGTPGTPGGS
ncbi:hypothetical protein [Streptomyces sp. NPDC058683]|uniref:effector-associated constant component EACC1 n=1 Tax=Streptomyces sp. NPDC058683 TaxID=3346597 RepID=UPI00365C971C